MTGSVDPRYPIGKLQFDADFNDAKRASAIDAIAVLPRALRAAVAGLNDSQLDTPYRDGGWTVRQVVHHLADSHAHAYVRFKLVVSENGPVLQAYDENAWAAMADGRTMPIEASLMFLEGMHARWVAFLKSLSADDFNRTGQHTVNGTRALNQFLQIYGWHGRHHVAHITELRKQKGW